MLGHCDHDGDNKAGYMGHGCLHMPFPFKPVLYRYGWGTDGSKGKKGRKPKNPYVGKIKTIVGESEDGKAFEYQGDALKEFKNITQAEDGEVVLDVLSYNGTLGVAWKVDSKDGLLKIYTPWLMDSGKWTVSATHLTPDCKIEFDYKGGRYPTREAALDAVWKAAEDHKKKLNEFIAAA